MTRKIVFLFVVIIVGGLSVNAQKLGFIGGPSLNHGTIVSSDKQVSFISVPGGGLHVGLLFEMDVTNRWGFETAAMYELRTMRWNVDFANDTVDYTESTFKRQLGYLNVPFHFYVNFPMKNQMVMSLFGGPVFTCALHGEDWAWENTDMRKPVTYAREKIFDKDEGRIARCEIAAELGLALKWKNIQGRLSYQYGFNNGTTNKYTYTVPLSSKTVNYFTQGTLKLSVAYLFDLRK